VQQNCANGGEEDPKPFLKNFRNLKLGLWLYVFFVLFPNYLLSFDKGGNDFFGGVFIISWKKLTSKMEEQKCIPSCNAKWVGGHIS
jgi:hypothetical protein